MRKLKAYLLHILQECEFLINNSVGISFEEFTDNPVLERASARNLEVIGELNRQKEDPDDWL